MSNPFSAPFRGSELLGVFRWSTEFSASFAHIDRRIFVAVHGGRLRDTIAAEAVLPDRSFDTIVRGVAKTKPCSWWSLQNWGKIMGSNFFGPFVVHARMKRIEGRRFYVYQRPTMGGKRIFFVERKTTRPLHIRPAKSIDPKTLFTTRDGYLRAYDSRNYEFVLRTPVALNDAKVGATGHRDCKCGSNRCHGGITGREAHQSLARVLGRELPEWSRVGQPPRVPIFS
jgi:hypothetical protein